MKVPVYILFALGTALCWGLYGSVLGKARAFEGSPFKPYVFIGVAYLVWAIAGGFLAMKLNGEPVTFTKGGMTWGFFAGTLGAWGAFCLTMAMFKGGGPHAASVMAVVFGCAVTVSALATLFSSSERGSNTLWLGIAGMLICTVVVALNTPHPHPPKKKAPESVEASNSGTSVSEVTNES